MAEVGRNVVQVGTGLLVSIIMLVSTGCASLFSLPSPPKGTWWDRGAFGANLISENGNNIAAFVGRDVWLFECNNQSFTFRTRDQAIKVVVACGAEYVQRGGK